MPTKERKAYCPHCYLLLSTAAQQAGRCNHCDTGFLEKVATPLATLDYLKAVDAEGDRPS